jgi:hypothetical protein
MLYTQGQIFNSWLICIKVDAFSIAQYYATDHVPLADANAS